VSPISIDGNVEGFINNNDSGKAFDFLEIEAPPAILKLSANYFFNF